MKEQDLKIQSEGTLNIQAKKKLVKVVLSFELNGNTICIQIQTINGVYLLGKSSMRIHFL